MFGNATVKELRIENEKLKLQAQTLELQLSHEKELSMTLESQIRDLKAQCDEDIKKENDRLKKEVEKLNFKIEEMKFGIKHDMRLVEAQRKLTEAETINNAMKKENEYLKRLLDTYREMPDIKNMIKSLSSITVPNIAELKEFAKIVSESKLDKVCTELAKTTNAIDEMYREFRYAARYR